jgi:hypothetical protein
VVTGGYRLIYWLSVMLPRGQALKFPHILRRVRRTHLPS